MDEERKQEVRDAVETAIRYTGRFFHCTFGSDWTEEEKTYAVHVGKNFNVRRDRDGSLTVSKPAPRPTLSGI